jgi:HEAT repeat protein
MKLKLFFLIALFLFFCNCIFSQTDTNSQEEKSDDDSRTEREERLETLKFGIEGDIVSLLDKLIKEKNSDYASEILSIFNKTHNVKVREKTLEYFIALEDPALKDYAIAILEDPYDEKKSTVNMAFRYISELKIKEACPCVVELIKSDNEDYYDNCISTLGRIGGASEAQYLAELLDTEDLSTGRKQALMRSLGELKAVETFDKLVEIAKDTEENTFVRCYAAQAIGDMEKEEAIDVLSEIFEETDNNLRTYVIKGLSNFNTEKSNNVILDGLKDSYYKIRIEAAKVTKKQKISEAVPFLIYRAKNDPENSVKYECYSSLAAIKTPEAVDYLISVVKDKKLSETARAKAVTFLFENSIEKAYEPVFTVARTTLKDDKLKNLRYSIGKDLAKYENPLFESICADYLAHKDIPTAGTGLDIFQKNKFPGLIDTVRKMAQDKKENANRRKARQILNKAGIAWTEDESQEKLNTENKSEP